MLRNDVEQPIDGGIDAIRRFVGALADHFSNGIDLCGAKTGSVIDLGEKPAKIRKLNTVGLRGTSRQDLMRDRRMSGAADRQIVRSNVDNCVHAPIVANRWLISILQRDAGLSWNRR